MRVRWVVILLLASALGWWLWPTRPKVLVLTDGTPDALLAVSVVNDLLLAIDYVSVEDPAADPDLVVLLAASARAARPVGDSRPDVTWIVEPARPDTTFRIAPRQRAHPIFRGVPDSWVPGEIDRPALPSRESAVVTQPPVALLLRRDGGRTAAALRVDDEEAPRRAVMVMPLVTKGDPCRAVLANTLAWACGRNVPTRGMIPGQAQKEWRNFEAPPPPERTIPHDATALFTGRKLDAWSPVRPEALPDDGELPRVDRTRQWGVSNKSLVPRAGGPDLWTVDAFESYLLHADVFVPKELSLPDAWRGRSGIVLNDRYEIIIADSQGRDPDLHSFGAIAGLHAPHRQAALPAGQWQSIDIAFDQMRGQNPLVSVWVNGEAVQNQVELTENSPSADSPPAKSPPVNVIENPELSFEREDMTVLARFRASGDGTIFSRSPTAGPWQPDAKAVFLRGGELVYDIGWLGAMAGGNALADGEWHTVALAYRERAAHLYVDGEPVSQRPEFHREDVPSHVFKIGSASPNFGGDLEGDVEQVLYYDRALDDAEIVAYAEGRRPQPTPRLEWFDPEARSRGAAPEGRIRLHNAGSEVHFANAYVQELPNIDHADYCAEFDEDQLELGGALFARVCRTCHGGLGFEGSQPNARNFYTARLENGSDPYRLFQTISYGYKQMVGQSALTIDERYALVHYLREKVFAEHNPDQYFRVTDEYLDGLPKARRVQREDRPREPGRRLDVYRTMNFGPSLNWTFEVAEGQIAYKGLAQRLDGSGRHSEGGVSQGEHWVVFDHDTLRLAAGWSGDFVDWKGIAFDGTHGTHTRIGSEADFVNPVGPGWARPGTEDFTDPRFRGRDGKPYGPLPRDWAHYRGHYHSELGTAVAYTVGDSEIVECAEVIERAGAPVFVRSLAIGPSMTSAVLRVAPTSVAVTSVESTSVASPGSVASLETLDGFHVLRIPTHEKPLEVAVLISREPIGDVARLGFEPQSPTPRTRGGARRWRETVTTKIERDAEREWPEASRGPQPYAVDEIVTPHDNPYDSWMRLGGHDFFADGNRAAVCTWLGDVWIVSGIAQEQGDVEWQRVASGLFQPLGLKIIDEQIFVSCRDQIVRLVDLDGDGCTDFYENFNNDHQVTEHFHEFAMGLQADDDGNLYYAKSARHAKTALVPQHGTLIKVSADGRETTILANGFRAANGVCLNPDGSFYVTDQEGHWMPKNRINRVEPGGYFGNYFGYHDRSDSDDDMNPPLCWLTNRHDRSPAELLWAKSDRWGPLSGKLLQVSYGTGRIFTVMEQSVGGTWQGGQVPLPLPVFPTGIMRGRFNPEDGQLYVSGMFAWAGNRQEPGGFYRVRYTGNELVLPIGYVAKPGALEFEFSCELDREFFAGEAEFEVAAWDLRRSASYGSPHLNERTLEIVERTLLDDGRTVRLSIPSLKPSWGMKTRFRVRSKAGTEAEDEVHHSIFALGER